MNEEQNREVFMGAINKLKNSIMNEQESIVEGNRIIADFMGLNKEGDLYSSNSLKFHLSWDWLMPVVEKIESKGYDIFINGFSCWMNDSGQTDFLIESGNVTTKIEATWSAVIEFIKWHDSQERTK